MKKKSVYPENTRQSSYMTERKERNMANTSSVSVRKRLISALCAIVLIAAMALTIPAPALAAKLSIAEVRNSVVVVAALWDGKQYPELITGYGSGFFLENPKNENSTYLITNHHVIEFFLTNGAGELRNVFYVDIEDEDGTIKTVPVYDEGRTKLRVYYDEKDYEDAFVVDYDETKDLAILRLSSPTSKRIGLELTVPTQDYVGQTVHAIGYPGTSDNIYFTPSSSWGVSDSTVTTGTVSRLFIMEGGVETLQLDLDINHGNSGGPLVDENGAAIGVNSWGISWMNMNYASNISETIRLLNRNDIPYVIYPGPIPPPNYALYAIVAAVVIAAAVAAFLLKKKKSAAQSGGTGSASATEYRLQGVSGAFAGRRFAIKAQMRMGRDPSANELVFPEGTKGVSGRHCRLSVDNGSLYIEDLGSTYGTFFRGQKIPAGTRIQLEVGDQFYLADQKESFRIDKSDKQAGA